MIRGPDAIQEAVAQVRVPYNTKQESEMTHEQKKQVQKSHVF